MSEKMLIGVIVADVDEYSPFVKAACDYNPKEYSLLGKKGITFDINGATVICINCGIGKVNASAVASALASLNCTAILNFGLSGGISGASRGGLFVPDKFLEHDFDLTVLGYKPCEKPNQKYIYEVNKELKEIFKSVADSDFGGTAVCGDRFISSKNDSDFLRDTFSATTCDMETAAIASVCDMADIPFAALRRISDDAGDSACESYTEMNNSGELYIPKIFLNILSKVADLYGGKA